MITDIKIDTLIKCLGCLLVMSIVTALKFCSPSDADGYKSKSFVCSQNIDDNIMKEFCCVLTS